MKSAITENYVACEFKNKGLDLYYWKSKATAEVDFLVNTMSAIIPVEVKSSTNNGSKRLNSYSDKYNPKYRISISLNNFGFSNDIFAIQLYAVFALADDLKSII